MHIAVIICAWDPAASLRQTLLSLGSETGMAPETTEVIVINNNSRDETGAVVERMQASWQLGTLHHLFEAR